MSTYFYNIKQKTIIAVAKQFNDIIIERKDGNSISVPIVYGRKATFYRRLNDNKGGKSQLTLPAMSIFNTEFVYDYEKQANNLSLSTINVSKENQNIIQYLKNPSPIEMTFELTIKSVYYQDLNRIEEQIIPLFQPSRVVSVNLIPEMNITLDLNVTLVDIAQNIETNIVSVDDNTDFETVLTFKTTTYLFPPIKQRYVARQIDVYNDITKLEITDNKSPGSIINDSLLSFTDYDKKQLKYVEISATSDKRYNKIHIVDLSSELSSEGENMKVIDMYGNELEFVFEYDNGEFYSSDEYIPTGISANKTGNMYISIPFIDENKKYTLTIHTHHTNAYFFARDVFHDQYNDFNIRSYKYVDIEDKNSEKDKVYINDGGLYVKTESETIEDIIKVYSKNSMVGTKTIKIGVTSFRWESDKFICGVTDGEGNHLYIKTSTNSNIYSVCTYDGTETEQFTLNAGGSLSEIIFEYDGSDWTVTINSTSNSFTGDDYYTPFLSNNSSNLIIYDYFYMFDSIS